MLTDYWPLRGIRLTTPRLELRLPSEEELAELADLAARGVHPPGEMPFLTPWTDRPPTDRGRYVIQQHWQRLGTWSPQEWALELAVFHRGRPVGVQDMRARDFALRREITTGSWLGLDHHGHGFGTEMRAAVLHFAFTELGCLEATTASFADNPAPLKISRNLGYRPDGIARDVLNGRTVISQRLRLSRSDWQSSPRPPVTVTTPNNCLPLFGIT
ncbi:GNAT family N-acetyltransferase [Actinomadura violacea]|uniref:GNAT family N-acetyltransferase n=1 Tax=Actinomadura violacea TaxID=2819934 RepID=UPI0027DAEA23|nr:GNAT family protein [Actinomadura violacea]